MKVISLNYIVVAGVVVYRPELEKLVSLVNSTLPQVSSCVLVINEAPDDLPAQLARQGVEVRSLVFVSMGYNRGVATAQNAGIAAAREARATHVLLLDQDSVPATDMVLKFLEALENNPNAAAVGPRYIDSRQENPPPFTCINGLRLTRCGCVTESLVVRVDYLISSGCLIPLHIVDRIGGMRDELFIDYIDVEWGLRARRHGFESYGVCAAKMQHNLGDYPLKFFSRKIPLHSPLRHYFHFRNAILLYREAWVPLNWKLVDGWRLLLKYGFYTLFAKPRLAHFRMMTLGVWHGFLGKVGPFSDKREYC